MPQKIVIVNTDGRGSGISSLGAPDRIQARFGYPPITARSWKTVSKVFDRFGEIGEKVVKVNINGEELEDPREVFVFAKNYENLDAFIVDPIDGVFWGIKQHLIGDSLAGNQSTWEKLTNASIKFFDKLGSMEIPVIATCHQKGEQIADDNTIQPFVQGTFKSQMGSYFDIILYSLAKVDFDKVKELPIA